jgi:hypothetical protein
MPFRRTKSVYVSHAVRTAISYLESDGRRVESFEIEVAEWSRLPDVGDVGLCQLLNRVVLIDVEQVELFDLALHIEYPQIESTYILSFINSKCHRGDG